METSPDVTLALNCFTYGCGTVTTASSGHFALRFTVRRAMVDQSIRKGPWLRQRRRGEDALGSDYRADREHRDSPKPQQGEKRGGWSTQSHSPQRQRACTVCTYITQCGGETHA
ncbi:hypothetical_protein [Leishmania major strain Friedlin]|nr:hypothetical_protein [Leishmania major strain Friedlin]